jgi:hypothetical protein
MMHMAALRRALSIRPRVGGGVDREPPSAPPRARLPYLRRLVGGHVGQRGLEQPVVDLVVLSYPRSALVPVRQRWQGGSQQDGERLLVDLPGRQRVIQRAVPAAEGRHQRQLY